MTLGASVSLVRTIYITKHSMCSQTKRLREGDLYENIISLS